MRTTIEAERIARLLGAWRLDDAMPQAALCDALAELVDGAHLPAGWRMPGQRELAQVLGVARGTVSGAYTRLERSGRLVTRGGSGTYVSRPGGHRPPGGGRLRSFDGAGPRLDLSSGALPGSARIASVLPEVERLLRTHHLREPGYHPAGLPELRTALATELHGDRSDAAAARLMVTAGSQQALWLVATALAGPGSVTVVEDPTYRGALEALALSGSRVVGVPFGPHGLDLDHLDSVLSGADLLYVQPSLHNPTGAHTDTARRRALAAIADRHGVVVVDDQSQADLARVRSGRLPGLEGLVAPDRLVTVGTLSKLFWGGLRVGWLDGPRELVSRMTDLRRAVDLGGPVTDQLVALLLLPALAEERDARRDLLDRQLRETTRVLQERLPAWTWWDPAGGAGLWVETGTDAVQLAQRALARDVLLTAGPAFSPHGGHRSRLRLPLWHPPALLDDAARVIAELVGA
ncbi:PLP-dependent aminotransferase family protein [Luteimicrobium xylanilyticum]|uniref:Aromatic-amino-acid aminotransferase n=1 Tax=Luteimicrobium xylanilyticum TaxID=1133546 RepID=A0A5P9Q715_9MICO|nr:PLP-dependent aminotransferase family protein [Luteimicrobium xylanilyticum]QFU97169.1 Aromatic-amino-acid aminotransferase [Luteimicrobium xylanilyticum]